MLVLSRKKMEQITIGDNIILTVMEISTGRVRIGIDAPKSMKVLRTELPVSQVEDVLVESTGETESMSDLLKI